MRLPLAVVLLLATPAPAPAAEGCVLDEEAVRVAVRAQDGDALRVLLDGALDRGCEDLEADGAPVQSVLVEQIRDALPRSSRAGRWIPRLNLTGDVGALASASSRIDAGRATAGGVRWSVGVALTFSPRAPSTVPELRLSRGESRAWSGQVDHVGSAAWLATSARLDALARWLGSRLTAIWTERSGEILTAADEDLRSRVLAAVDRQERRAQVGALIGAGVRP